MIYTTYFANLKNLDHSNSCPIAICGKSPDGYKGLEYKKLAPKWWFFKEWKENHDNDFYIENFNKEVLGVTSPAESDDGYPQSDCFCLWSGYGCI